MLIGNVGKEPDVRYYDQDQAVAQFPLATTERGYTLQNGTKVPEHTDWHTITVWRGLAKIVEKSVHKGDNLYIEGRIRYRSYDAPKRQRRYVTEILAENMELLTPKPVANDKDTVSPASQAQPQDNGQEATTAPEDNSALPF